MAAQVTAQRADSHATMLLSQMRRSRDVRRINRREDVRGSLALAYIATTNVVSAGLNVVESWNGGNDIVFHGNRGQLTPNRQDERELSVLCLRILQTSLVYINTLMLQEVFNEPADSNSSHRLTGEA